MGGRLRPESPAGIERKTQIKMSSYLKNKSRRFLIKIVHSIFRDPSVKKALWEITNRPIIDYDTVDFKTIVADPWRQLWSYVGWQTAEFIDKNMINIPVYENSRKLLESALSRVKVDGLYLEFGAGHKALSINFIAERIDKIIHGFDSFEGLPEDWFGRETKGRYTTHGQLPNVRENVKLHVGLFEQTLPDFIKTHNGQIAFMHIDCDLYASTKTVFDILENRINSGTVMQFDEYFNYPGWKNHEFKAFQEFITKSGLKYEYLGYSTQFSVSVIIK